MDGDTYKDSHSFSGAELLRIARLAEIIYSEFLIRVLDRKPESPAQEGSDQ